MAEPLSRASPSDPPTGAPGPRVDERAVGPTSASLLGSAVSSRSVVAQSRFFAWARPRAAGPEGEGAERPGSWRARQRYHRALVLVIGAWAVVTCVAAAVYPPAALVAAVAGIAHILVGYRVEQRRRTEEGVAQPEPR